MKPLAAVVLLVLLVLLGAALFLGFRLNNGLNDILVVNATTSDLNSVRLSLVDRTCDLDALPVGAVGRCRGRAARGEGEVTLELTWAGGRRATVDTARYVNPNFGWSGLVVIDKLDPPHAIATGTDQIRHFEAW